MNQVLKMTVREKIISTPENLKHIINNGMFIERNFEDFLFANILYMFLNTKF